ncbi:MAG: hypothetical protein HYT73_01025 [Candidatus Aenigmarchaeota archaeon]|nr:hypothetical protein [Candidatus Aenigmarchaeota archaeon]
MLGLFKQGRAEVELEGLERFMSDSFAGDIENSGKKMSRLEDESLSVIESLKKSVEELRSIENASTFTSVLKNRYCDKSMEAASSVSKPPEDYVSRKLFSDSLAAAISEISNIDIKEFRHLGAFSIKMSKISSYVSQLKKLHSSYASILKSSRLEDVFAAGASVRNLTAKYDKCASLRDEVKKSGKSAEFIGNSLKSLKIRIHELEKKIEEAGSKTQSVYDDEKRKDMIETSLSTEFGSLERSIRKFLHDCEDMIEKGDTETMKLYAENPGSAFLRHDDGSVFRRNVIKMREAISSGRLKSDDSLEKIDRMIRRMDFFLAMKKEHSDISKSLEKLLLKAESAKKPIMNQKQDAERQAEALSSELEKISESERRMSSEIRQLTEEIRSGMEKLSSWSSEKTGKRIEIKHSFIL